MNRSKVFYAFFNSLHCIPPTYILAASWGVGLLLGIAYGYRGDPSFELLMRTAVSGRMSIVGLTLLLYVPLLLSALAVYLKFPHFLILVCFSKAFLFASCGASLHMTFGSAAWLVRLLLQFSDICALPFFYWFCMRNITGLNERTRPDLLICCIAFAVMGLFDFTVISPFLVKCINI